MQLMQSGLTRLVSCAEHMTRQLAHLCSQQQVQIHCMPTTTMVQAPRMTFVPLCWLAMLIQVQLTP